jgi:hypothetical protein
MAARLADTPQPGLRLVREGEGVAAQDAPAEAWRPGLCHRCTRRRKVRNRALCRECLTYEFPFLALAPACAPPPRQARARPSAAPAPSAPAFAPRRRPPRQLDLIERHHHLEVYGSRPRSIGNKRLTRKERRELAEMTLSLAKGRHYNDRPKTWGECQERIKGPCPWVSCRHHMLLEVDADIVKINFPGKAIGALEETCSLRVAEDGKHTLERIGELLNITLERSRQLEEGALQKMKRMAAVLLGEE